MLWEAPKFSGLDNSEAGGFVDKEADKEVKSVKQQVEDALWAEAEEEEDVLCDLPPAQLSESIFSVSLA